jgi:hypothetical protein
MENDQIDNENLMAAPGNAFRPAALPIELQVRCSQERLHAVSDASFRVSFFRVSLPMLGHFGHISDRTAWAARPHVVGALVGRVQEVYPGSQQRARF